MREAHAFADRLRSGLRVAPTVEGEDGAVQRRGAAVLAREQAPPPAAHRMPCRDGFRPAIAHGFSPTWDSPEEQPPVLAGRHGGHARVGVVGGGAGCAPLRVHNDARGNDDCHNPEDDDSVSARHLVDTRMHLNFCKPR